MNHVHGSLESVGGDVTGPVCHARKPGLKAATVQPSRRPVGEGEVVAENQGAGAVGVSTGAWSARVWLARNRELAGRHCCRICRVLTGERNFARREESSQRCRSGIQAQRDG